MSNTNTTRFNDALLLAAHQLHDAALPAQWSVGVIRDVFGRIRLVVNCDADAYPAEAKARLGTLFEPLTAYASPGPPLFRDDFANPDQVFASADWHTAIIELGPDAQGVPINHPLRLMDRQIVGQDWLRPGAVTEAAHPPRIVFYGLKGGVGRSTALTMVAYGLARDGKRVLLLDLDLESPGLSGLLLPSERVADYGLIDWFVEDAVGQGDSLLGNLVTDSPLAEGTLGNIRVATAMGREESDYLSKLARAYADIPSKQGPQRFAVRLERIVTLLEQREAPDVVLIDSRAGLHDIAAVAITRLADMALLFATDSEQTWQGYRQLFSFWQRRPGVCKQVREKLNIVQALAPKSDREGRSRRFRERAYELFADTLYDEVPASDSDPSEYFAPDLNDSSAPHFPIRVDWDEVFQEFDPRLRPEDGGVSDAEIDAKFGAAIEWAKGRIAELIED
ncbi:MAG: AAA family ATPase [Rhodocyclaceae bacterium]|nr:AAA family ATPase [Rhodocyclaceae bacterium]